MPRHLLPRLLPVPERSFFLFGPRGTGKSTWLKTGLPDAAHFDLLDASLHLELSRNPHVVEAMVGNRPAKSWVLLDEIQKIPALLDEVHRLVERRRWRFALCGSSARKLKRHGTNLLAGRAITLGMEGFSGAELGDRFELKHALEWGTLPVVWSDPAYEADILAAYVNTYLKEEIREEGLVRNVPPFLRFLQIAGMMNGQVVNAANIAREASVARANVDTWFSILTDTLLGHFLPAWQPRLKVREQSHPKFYWFDAGVARAAAGLHRDPADRTWLGFSLETLVYHETRVHNEVSRKHRPISFYGTASGTEIDFIIETRKASIDHPPHIVCVEVKLAEKWDRKWERAMRDLASRPGVKVDRMFGVYTGTRTYSSDGIEIVPVSSFLRGLHEGKVF